MRRILVCDDEDVLRTLVREVLSDAYEIVEAEDGEQALARALEHRPDLVILDMMMPGRSGIEVLRAVRGHPELARTPVLMLTARTQPADREAAERAGADSYLAKPFSPLGLVHAVEALLERPG